MTSFISTHFTPIDEIKIGSAWINRDRCIPYALGRPCIVCGICENKCPVMDDPADLSIRDRIGRIPLPDGKAGAFFTAKAHGP